ncbi:MAG: CRISPR-associated endonuclease Cas1 [Candidatus Coatesbacteria bacterium]|nr:CRISPR-associated endonuclease Cas1 [Candidatus Coatesbacteria bacterium]
MDRDDLLSVYAVAEHTYCPRSFYYHLHGHVGINRFIADGRVRHTFVDEPGSRSHSEVKQELSVHLGSEELGLSGVADILEENADGTLTIVDYKRGEDRDPNLFQRVQLCLLALLVEEERGVTVERGFIHFVGSNKRREVVLDQELRERSLRALHEARALARELKPPPPVNDQRCRGCMHYEVCLPEEVDWLSRGAVGGLTKGTPLAALPEGRTVYIDKQGAYVGKRADTLRITYKREELTRIPLTEVRKLCLFGNVNLSTAAVRELLRRDIPIVYLSGYGRYEGIFLPERSGNVPLRLAQYRARDDAPARLELCRAFVSGKLHNCRTLLGRYARESGDDTIVAARGKLKALMKDVERVDTVDSLLGLEGAAAREYFAAFARCIAEEPPFDFTRRTRRPPADPVNALLSFTYTLVTTELIAACHRVGLDPHLGLYHTPLYGRPGLALDLLEELRPIFADALVLALINRREFNTDDFETRFGGVFLKKSARLRFYERYEDRKHDEIVHPVFKYKVSYRRLFELQARILAKTLPGELPGYLPYKAR